MEPVNIGLLGLGTVASGTLNVLQRNAAEITRRAGRAIHVKSALVHNLQKERTCNTDSIQLTTDPQAIVADPELDIVVELIGGDTLAKDLVLQALSNGKHVVTANKALIAKEGNAIFERAYDQGLMIAFEGAVAGGIPIIKAVREGLAGNRIHSVCGILNGTCNYILTAMQNNAGQFDEVLKRAQVLGYAEADPKFDIEGIDVAHKLTILASIAFGIPLQFDHVYIEGITGITCRDMQYADQLGFRIKHLGITKCHEEGVELRVHPTLIPKEHTLAHVNGVMNALLVDADAVGQTLYYGAGAGAEPTASAVVADLVDVVRTLTADPNNRVPHLAFQADALADLPILPMEEIETAYYLRLLAANHAGVLAEITHILGQAGISIESILQKEAEQQDGRVPVIIMTHPVKEKQMNAAIASLEAIKDISNPVVRIRLERL